MKKIVIMLLLGGIAIAAEPVPVGVQQVIDNALSGKEFNRRVSNFMRECRSYGFDSGSTSLTQEEKQLLKITPAPASYPASFPSTNLPYPVPASFHAPMILPHRNR